MDELKLLRKIARATISLEKNNEEIHQLGDYRGNGEILDALQRFSETLDTEIKHDLWIWRLNYHKKDDFLGRSKKHYEARRTVEKGDVPLGERPVNPLRERGAVPGGANRRRFRRRT